MYEGCHGQTGTCASCGECPTCKPVGMMAQGTKSWTGGQNPRGQNPSINRTKSQGTKSQYQRLEYPGKRKRVREQICLTDTRQDRQ